MLDISMIWHTLKTFGAEEVSEMAGFLKSMEVIRHNVR
jgi:hypothetical protein